MRLKAILALFFIVLLSTATIVDARGSSSRSSSSSSRSSSSSYSSSRSSSYSTSSRSTPTVTTPTSTSTKSYSTTGTKPTTSNPSYGGTTTSTPRSTSTTSTTTKPSTTTTTTTRVYNTTYVDRSSNGGNGILSTAVGTFAGMAVYDMITDENWNQVQAAPYYMSGSERITVSGEYTKAPVKQPTEPVDWGLFFKWFLWISGWIIFIAILASIFNSSNRY